MTNVIKPRRTPTAAKVPTTADLADGELGANTTDKKLYIRVGAAIVELCPPGAAAWGGITGTLASQTDLNNALNLKVNVGTAYADYAASNVTLYANASAFDVNTLLAGQRALVQSGCLNTPGGVSGYWYIEAVRPYSGSTTIQRAYGYGNFQFYAQRGSTNSGATWTAWSVTNLAFDPATKADLTGAAFTGHISAGTAAIGTGNTAVAFGAKMTVHGAANTQTSLNIWQAGIGTGQIGFLASSNTMRIVNAYSDGLLANGVGIDILASGNVYLNGVSGPDNIYNKLRVTGGITIAGTVAQLGFLDRSNQAVQYALYGNAGAINFYGGSGVGTILSIAQSGEMTGTGISNAAGGNTIVKRNPSGYIFANYFNTTADVTPTKPSHMAVFTGSDNYIRQQTFDQFYAHLAAAVSPASSNIYDIGTTKLMRWKHYGTGHVIFDASNSTSPAGSAVNNTNPEVAWSGSYPTLMGWNGSNTYGVRVDVCRLADAAAGLISTNSYNVRDLTVSRGDGTGVVYYGSTGAQHTYWDGTKFNIQGMDAQFSNALYAASTIYQLSANGAAWVRQPRVFVQSADPGAQAADGDLWFW